MDTHVGFGACHVALVTEAGNFCVAVIILQCECMCTILSVTHIHLATILYSSERRTRQRQYYTTVCCEGYGGSGCYGKINASGLCHDLVSIV